MLKMSQEKLGEALGVTFQQIQKYERGANRVGSGRLQEIADALGVDAAYFFEGQHGSGDESPKANAIDKFLSSNEGTTFALAFMETESPAQRRALLELIRTMSGKAP
jgi:transcriptional regulator with XRE-family HTH domain